MDRASDSSSKTQSCRCFGLRKYPLGKTPDDPNVLLVRAELEGENVEIWSNEC
jgi:hypothetical protein